MSDHEVKVCPIMTAGNVGHGVSTSVAFQHQTSCLENNCGIWDEDRKCCGLIPRKSINTDTSIIDGGI